MTVRLTFLGWRRCQCGVVFNRKPGPLGRLDLCTRCAAAAQSLSAPGDGTVAGRTAAGAEVAAPSMPHVSILDGNLHVMPFWTVQ